jgi:glycine hydroxymethyltransferase
MSRIATLTLAENARQRNTLNLIASENYPSPAVLALLGSQWSNKYGEGYPGKRYYAGNTYTDEMERYVQELALKAFDTTGEYATNVQVLSGSPANMMIYLALLEYGDTVMSVSIPNGGHLSHVSSVSNWNKFFKKIEYDVVETDKDTFEIDYADFAQKLSQHKPKLVIIGFSAYPRAYQFEAMTRLAHEHGALVLADIAHINGLVAAGLHDTPFQAGAAGADFISMTTHKTLRGPRGALLFFKKEYEHMINKTIFPGTSGGPHFHQMAATGRALEEVLGIEKYPDERTFLDYSQAVITNTKALENGLAQAGITIISPTQTHLCLIRLPDAIDSLQMQQMLETQGFITNRNTIPFDPKSPWRPSGIRLGMAALTSRGISSDQSLELGTKIAEIISGADHTTYAQNLSKSLQWYYYTQSPHQVS